MSETELQAQWTKSMGEKDFQNIDFPKYVRPGGNYGDRLFYFSEPAVIILDGIASKGKLTLGKQTFNYMAATYPFSNDSAISYFKIKENSDFNALMASLLPGLKSRAKADENTWNLSEIGKFLSLPPKSNSYFLDWANLPNFDWVISSILVRRASQQGKTHDLALQGGELKNIVKAEILQGGDNKNALIAALYDPAAMENMGGEGKFPLWMLLAAAGAGMILPLGFMMFRRKPKQAETPARMRAGEVEILEEDPRFVNLSKDLEKAMEPKDLLKVLSRHFDDSDSVASVLTQTKLQLDKARKADGNREPIRIGNKKTVAEENPGNEDLKNEGEKPPVEKDKEEQQEVEKKAGSPAIKAKIQIKDESLKKKDSVEAERPEKEEAKPEQKEETAKKETKPKSETKPEPEIREVIKEVIKEVIVKEKPNREQLMKRLSNQESLEEKLLAAVSYWDSEFDMEGEYSNYLKTVLRSFRTMKKVKDGFGKDNLRSALNTLALSFGEGNTTKVKQIMDRSEAIDQFLKDVEADRLAPEAGRDDERGKTAAHLAELIRGLSLVQRVARKEIQDGPQADYQKAIDAMLLGFLLEGTAKDVATGKEFEELKARMDGRLSLFKDDVRFAQNQIQAADLAVANKLVLAFAGETSGNAYYEAYLKKYGDFFDKLSSYEDPPTLEELREWWAQAFEMVVHAFDYFRYSLQGKENSFAKLNVMLVGENLRLHELPDGDVRPFSEKITDVPRAVRNAREMARSIGIAKLDKVLIEGFYIHPKSLEPID